MKRLFCPSGYICQDHLTMYTGIYSSCLSYVSFSWSICLYASRIFLIWITNTFSNKSTWVLQLCKLPKVFWMYWIPWVFWMCWILKFCLLRKHFYISSKEIVLRIMMDGDCFEFVDHFVSIVISTYQSQPSH